jgi:hypothetical protein
MSQKSSVHFIVLALLGWLFIAGYFWLLDQAAFVPILRPRVSLNQVIKKAEKEFKASPLGKHSLNRQDTVTIDEDILSFLQRYRPQNRSAVLRALGTVTVFWKGDVKVDRQNKEVSFELLYDFDGKPKGFKKVLPELPDSSALEIYRALEFAAGFLHSQNIDTSSLVISEKISKIENGIQTYELIFTRPFTFCDSLNENYEVNISGSTITGFTPSLTVNPEKLPPSKFEEISDTVFQVSQVVLWVIFVIVMAVIFFKRVKRDEIEFGRARWPGIAVMLILGLSVAINAWPAKGEAILGGLLAGLFMGVAALVVYALSESFTRDTWPEKIALIDILFRGYFRVKELGRALLTALFIGGLTAFFLGITIFVVEELHIGYIAIKSQDLWIFSSRWNMAQEIAKLLIGAFFFGLVLLSFFAAFIKSKIQSNAKLSF